MKHNSCLREVTLDDAKLILEWVNDPEDRANSFDSHVITMEEHLNWLSASLQDPSMRLYIMECDEMPVGHIKLKMEGESADIGYCIAPQWRGKGLSRELIRLIVAETTNNYPQIKHLTGEVRASNIPSRKLLASSGFRESSISYILDL